MTRLSSIGSQHEFAAYRNPAHGKTPLRLAGNTVVVATVTAVFAVFLSVFSPVVAMAFEDAYYFALRQLSAARGLVNYAASLY